MKKKMLVLALFLLCALALTGCVHDWDPVEDSLLDMIADDHTWSDQYEYNEEGHWKTCECGATSEVEAHIWSSDWVVKTEATCTTEGEQSRTCSVCGYVETQAIDKVAHNPGEWVTTKAATCTTTGLQQKSCTVCETVLDEKEIPATGHTVTIDGKTEGNWVITQKPTCTTSGKKELRCTVCSAVCDEEVINATGHTGGNWIIDKEADTCANPGSKHQICSVCSATIATESITIAHTYTKTGSDATSHWTKCSVCGVAQPSTTVAHTFVSKYNELGHWSECSICGYTTKSTNHKFQYDAEGHWGTCTECIYTTSKVQHTLELCNTDSTAHYQRCTACGYETEHINHTLKTYYDGTYHWTECEVCGYTSEKVKHDAKAYYNTTNHHYECTCGYKSDAEEHTLVWKVDADGKHYQACSFCAYQTTAEAHKLVTKYDTANHWEVCSVCGTILNESKHIALKYDDNGHWNKCTCGYTTNSVKHTLTWATDDAKGTHWQECTICDYETTHVSHTYVTKYTENTVGTDGKTTYGKHWLECSECGEVKVDSQTTHTMVKKGNESGHWTECTGCAYKTAVQTHTISHDAEGHWGSCSGCNYTAPETKTAHNFVFKEDAEGKEYRYCTICTYETEHTGHQLTTLYDETGHWTECSVCLQKSAVVAHTITTNYNATSHWTVCTECGYKTTEVAHTLVWKIDAQDKCYQACTECDYEGEHVAHNLTFRYDTTGHWSVCGDCSVVTVKVDHDALKSDADGHWNECECGYTTAKVAHTYELRIDNDGKHYKVCTVCGYETEHVDHQLTLYKNTSCHWYECSDCSYSTLPEAHTFDANGDCTVCGYHKVGYIQHN